MDIETILADVRDQLDQPDSSYLTDEIILRWLNQAQKVVARKTKCLQKKTDLTSVADQAEYEIADCLGVQQIFYWYGSTSGYRLRHITWRKAADMGLVKSVSGIPEVWIDQPDGSKRNIEIYPAPNTSGNTIRIYYYALPVEMVYVADGDPSNVDPEIPEEYQDILITWCRYKFRLMEEDTDQAAFFLNEFNNELKEIRSREFFKHNADAPEIALDYTF